MALHPAHALRFRAMAKESTLERHSRDGVLSEERSALHASIIERLLATAGARLHEAVLYAGGPASGKSSLAGKLGPSRADSFVLINPDDVRVMLPEYHEMVAAGDPDAASLTHDEAKAIAKAATDVAISLGLSLVIDAVGGDDEGQFSGKIRRLLECRYDVTVRYVTVPLPVAREREAARAAKTGRVVPAGVLTSKHAEVSRGFANVARIGGVRIEVYDNSGGEPILLAEGFGDPDLGVKALQVHDPAGYHVFLEKANP
jgi:predicted ABC-type ATPase